MDALQEDRKIEEAKDFDGNGTVDEWETELFSAKLDSSLSAGDIKSLKKLADTDGDLSVSEEELNDIFSLVDLNENGKLDENEIYIARTFAKAYDDDTDTEDKGASLDSSKERDALENAKTEFSITKNAEVTNEKVQEVREKYGSGGTNVVGETTT